MFFNNIISFRTLIVLVFCQSAFCGVYAQKTLITNDTYKTWNSAGQLDDYAVSANGEYIWFKVGASFSVVRSNGQPVQKIDAVDNAWFTPDSKTLVFIKENKLHLLDLKTLSVKKLPYEDAGSAVILTSHNTIVLSDQKKALIVWNIETGRSQKYEGVSEFKVNNQQTDIVAKKGSLLCWLDIKKNHLKVISEVTGSDFESVAFDPAGTGILFSVNLENKRGDNTPASFSYCYYDKQMPQARLFLDSLSLGLPPGYKVEDGSLSFNKDGRFVCLRLKPDVKEEKSTEPYQALWHYQETYLNNMPDIIIAGLATKPGASIQLLGKGKVEMLGVAGRQYVLLKKNFMRNEDVYWNTDMEAEHTLVSLEDGKQTIVLIHDVADSSFPRLSPNEKYIIWYDYAANEYLTYNISTGKTVNVTKDIDVPADIKYLSKGSIARKMSGYPAEWIGNDDSILLVDRYDVWQIDPAGQKPAINLTDGYGRKSKIEFQLTAIPSYDGKTFIAGQDIILRAMNGESSDNGFWQIKLGRKNKLEGGHLQPCLFSWNMTAEPRPIMKAEKANVFLVTRQTAAEAPNLYVTTDLKSYKKLTDIAPQRKYNWMTSERINYPMKRGKMNGAILFKPENFDAGIKYPVMFNYYQQRSDEVHRFRDPKLFKANIDVAWYVSNGYLVCMPDIINDEPGEIAKTTVNAVESAIEYLSQYSWFDTAKLGCQGQSFGGYETNILVTNSTRFAAANAMAAPSNLFSAYFGTKGFLGRGGGKSVTDFYEEGQTNLHTTPWDNPKIYIENSPIMQADKVITPLLLIHNRRDGAVPFNQAYEFFHALRRLKKPVWLFEYEGGHTEVGNDVSCLDFMIRQEQFFDHYLKGKPAPSWMLKGSNND